MAVSLKIKTGERFVLPEGGVHRFERELAQERLLFVSEDTMAPTFLNEAEFEKLLAAHAIKEFRAVRPDGSLMVVANDIDPLIGADDPRLARARALQFYVAKWDKIRPGLGRVALRSLLADHRAEAHRRGLTHEVSPQALHRAVVGCGVTGHRPLALFIDQRTQVRPGTRKMDWDAFVVALKAEMIAWYWSGYGSGLPPSTESDAISWFYKRFDPEAEARRESRDIRPAMKRPSDRTIRNWIAASLTRERYKAKFGEDAARRKFAGRGRGLEASRILEIVLIDHTVADAWVVMDDLTGLPLGRPTLTVVMDVHSRVILGWVLTFEPPGLFSTTLALKRAMLPKHHLLERDEALAAALGEAPDFWGKPETVIADNAWEFTGASLQHALDGLGIDMHWRPVRTPEYAAIIERFFGTLNKLLLHRVPGAAPFKPHEMKDREIDPAKDACITLSALEHLIHLAVETVYHREVHSSLGKAPALAWAESKRAHKRPFIADLSAIDGCLGQVAEGTVGVEGVHFRNMRFHDPDVTTALLDRLMGRERPSARSKHRSTGYRAKVHFTYNPADCSSIRVWDASREAYVVLPNWDRDYARGLSFWHSDRIREHAEARNLAFHSDEQRHAAREHLRQEIERLLPDMKFKDVRLRRRAMVPPSELERQDREAWAKSFGIAPEDVADAVEEATISGFASTPDDLPVDPAMAGRADHAPPKGPDRAGRAGRRKAAQTRARKKAEQAQADARTDGRAPEEAAPPSAPPSTPVPKADLSAIYAAMAGKVKAATGDSSGAGGNDGR